MMTGIDTDIQLKSEETVVNGDWAFDRGQFWLHVMSKDPKSTMPMVMDQGKYLVILSKQPDGTGWKIARAAATRASRRRLRSHQRRTNRSIRGAGGPMGPVGPLGAVGARNELALVIILE